MKTKKSQVTFEKAFNRLETILEKLEGENITLEETLELYEEGLTLTKFCYEKLSNAELKIKEITKSLKTNSSGKENK